ncbi:DUF4328 domain-containing protein [Actinomycetota bacterium]
MTTQPHRISPHPVQPRPAGPPAPAPVESPGSTTGPWARWAAAAVTAGYVLQSVLLWPVASLVPDGAPYVDGLVVLFTVLNAAIPAAALVATVLASVWLWEIRSAAARREPTYRFRWESMWSWLGWWVPLLNAVVPYQVLTQSWQALTLRSPRTPMPRFALWWLALVLSQLLGPLVPLLLDPDARTLRETVTVAGPAAALQAALSVLALRLWLTVVTATDEAARPASQWRGRPPVPGD